jgi:hypothetical protein
MIAWPNPSGLLPGVPVIRALQYLHAGLACALLAAILLHRSWAALSQVALALRLAAAGRLLPL